MMFQAKELYVEHHIFGEILEQIEKLLLEDLKLAKADHQIMCLKRHLQFKGKIKTHKRSRTKTSKTKWQF